MKQMSCQPSVEAAEEMGAINSHLSPDWSASGEMEELTFSKM